MIKRIGGIGKMTCEAKVNNLRRVTEAGDYKGESMKNNLEFIGIEVSYPEYKGKPYFAIKYKEDGQYIVGFGTYNPEVLSRYIKEYFINPKPILSRWVSMPRSAREEEESKRSET